MALGVSVDVTPRGTREVVSARPSVARRDRSHEVLPARVEDADLDGELPVARRETARELGPGRGTRLLRARDVLDVREAVLVLQDTLDILFDGGPGVDRADELPRHREGEER
jgi:hypothetical protein